MKNTKKILILITVVLTILTLSGCNKEVKTIKIAEQYGLAYAPLQVMKENGLLEEALGDEYEVEWIKLANTAAIREAMLGDDLDVGFMGIPPFLIGVDNGMEWKIISGLSESPLGLVVNDSSINTLEELVGQGKIALPQPGSIQHILLSMTAKDQLGDATIFDKQLISMKHPDGVLALNAGTEIVGHYTSPPFLFQELQNKDNHLLTVGTDGTKGEFTFIVGVCRENFHNDTKVYNKFNEALNKSIELLNEIDEETLTQLANSYELDKDILTEYLAEDGMAYGTYVKGVDKFIKFMADTGYISKIYTEKEVTWE